MGAVRLHAGGLDGGGDVLPEAAGCPVRAAGHRLPPLRPALRLQHPLRPPRRRQLQPHRRRGLLRRRSHQPLPLRRRAPVPGAGGAPLQFGFSPIPGIQKYLLQRLMRATNWTESGRRRCGRRSCHLRADAGAVQAHARGPLAQGGSPHRRSRRISAHFRHHHGCALDHRQGPPQPHHQDMDALHHHRLPRPLRGSLHRPVHEPSQCQSLSPFFSLPLLLLLFGRLVRYSIITFHSIGSFFSHHIYIDQISTPN